MKKSLTALIILFSIFLFTPSIVLSQNLNAHEESIYHAVVEEWHKEIYLSGDDMFKAEEKAIRWAANWYGYTEKGIYGIMDRGVGDRYPTKSEYQIYEELMKRLGELPEGASISRYEAIHSEIADKYGLTLPELHELEYLAYYDFGYWLY